jgi:hypothetical protein
MAPANWKMKRILVGESGSPLQAQALLASPDLDGRGASREGRDATALAEIVRLIAGARAATG